MEQALLVLGFGSVALLAVGGVVWFERKRQAVLAAFVRSHGWRLEPRDDRQVDRPGEPFGRGQRRRAQDVITGSWGGRDFVAFDYSFQTTHVTGQGQRQTTTYRYSVLAVRLPAFVPQVEITPANLLDRTLSLGVELESEDFNRRFRLDGDPRLVHDLLPPLTMEALLARPATPVRLLGAEAVNWESGRLDTTELLTRLDTVTALLDGVPDWLWRDLRGET